MTEQGACCEQAEEGISHEWGCPTCGITVRGVCQHEATREHADWATARDAADHEDPVLML